jgi:hypothetical protein
LPLPKWYPTPLLNITTGDVFLLTWEYPYFLSLIAKVENVKKLQKLDADYKNKKYEERQKEALKIKRKKLIHRNIPQSFSFVDRAENELNLRRCL